MLADEGFIEQFRLGVVSTTLAVAWVAAGRRAAYVTDGHLRDSVHLAAGTALCQAAGCVVTGLDGQPIHTGSVGGAYRVPPCMASQASRTISSMLDRCGAHPNSRRVAVMSA